MVQIDTSKILTLSDVTTAATDYAINSVLGQGARGQKAIEAVVISALSRFFADMVPVKSAEGAKSAALEQMSKNMIMVAILHAVTAAAMKRSVGKETLIGVAADAVAEKALASLQIEDTVILGSS